MSENCNHQCDSCQHQCGEQNGEHHCGGSHCPPPKAKLNEQSSIKKVIAVVSGKGGVGKSSVTALLAVLARRSGKKTGILDADITGPSIPKLFGLTERCQGNEFGIIPVMTKTRIPVVSINSLLDNETDPVLWRGPIIAGTVKQFWEQTIWDDLDVLFVDMPPGTGDVPLTVFQSLPIDGIVVVTSPQELVSMIVAKSVNMARMMNVPVLGLVENMAYFKCDECGKIHHIFGESHLMQAAAAYEIPATASLPLDPATAAMGDKGEIESFAGTELDEFIKTLDL